MSNCPDCGHPKADHTALMGCLASDDPQAICECDRSFREDKTTAQMEAEKAEAMDQAERGTDDDWRKEAVAAIEMLARRSWDRRTGDPFAEAEFTSDSVWVLLEELAVPPPREPRALGPILRDMAKGPDAKLKPVGYAPSKRRHGAPVRTYVGVRP